MMEERSKSLEGGVNGILVQNESIIRLIHRKLSKNSQKRSGTKCTTG